MTNLEKLKRDLEAGKLRGTITKVPRPKQKKKKLKKIFRKPQKEVPKSKENWFRSKGAKGVKASPMEKMVASILRDLKIYYHREVSFKDLNPSKTPLGYLRFDFYIPSANAVIEYDGKAWHNTEEQLTRDHLKDEYCRAHGIKMIRLVAQDIPRMKEKLKIYLSKN